MTKTIHSLLIASLLLLASCEKQEAEPQSVAPVSLRDVPSLRLNYKYEGDVPSPYGDVVRILGEDVNAAVRADFAANRPQESLISTVTSPNKDKVIAVYQRLGDLAAAYRLDMYAADGNMIRQITPESMSVNFPKKIVWSPDGTNFAFAAMVRESAPGLSTFPAPTPSPTPVKPGKTPAPTPTPKAAPTPGASPSPVPTPRVGEVPPNVLTFRTEQIYIASSEGTDVRAVTQNEGLIYFHFTWSPDSAAIVALAATFQEWRFLQFQADQRSEIFVPKGRPRVVEKNGRERLLDDNLTSVHPVWSPDSTKVAVGFDTQIRLYDALSVTPTQAAVPLRNQLLISSQAYDAAKKAQESATDANTGDANTAVQPTPPPTTLPDEKDLESFQPIIELAWGVDDVLHFQTGFVKEFKIGEGARSSLRWHRLILSPQATTLGK